MQNQFVGNAAAEDVARFFRFYAQDINPRITFKRELGNIPVKSFYIKYKIYFDKITKILNKYKIDPDKFIRIAISQCGVFHPKNLLSIDIFKRYAVYLQKMEQYKKIYHTYLKTVNFIAEKCLETRVKPKRYILNLFSENRLASEYISGRISKYFIVTLNTFFDFFPKMDSLSKDELCIIFNARDELEVVVQDAFLLYEGKRANPMELIEAKLKQLILKQTNNNQEKQKCAHSAQTSN